MNKRMRLNRENGLSRFFFWWQRWNSDWRRDSFTT